VYIYANYESTLITNYTLITNLEVLERFIISVFAQKHWKPLKFIKKFIHYLRIYINYELYTNYELLNSATVRN